LRVLCRSSSRWFGRLHLQQLDSFSSFCNASKLAGRISFPCVIIRPAVCPQLWPCMVKSSSYKPRTPPCGVQCEFIPIFILIFGRRIIPSATATSKASCNTQVDSYTVTTSNEAYIRKLTRTVKPACRRTIKRAGMIIL